MKGVSASSGLMGDQRDTIRAREEEEASGQETVGINSNSYSNSRYSSSISNSSIHSKFSFSSSSIPSTIMEGVTAMSSPLMAMFSPWPPRMGQ